MAWSGRESGVVVGRGLNGAVLGGYGLILRERWRAIGGRGWCCLCVFFSSCFIIGRRFLVAGKRHIGRSFEELFPELIILRHIETFLTLKREGYF